MTSTSKFRNVADTDRLVGLKRVSVEAGDGELTNLASDTLSAESVDVLEYQAPIFLRRTPRDARRPAKVAKIHTVE
jgi:hypothetical protein